MQWRSEHLGESSGSSGYGARSRRFALMSAGVVVVLVGALGVVLEQAVASSSNPSLATPRQAPDFARLTAPKRVALHARPKRPATAAASGKAPAAHRSAVTASHSAGPKFTGSKAAKHPVTTTTTTTTTAPSAPCTPNDLQITTSTDASSYAAGQPVHIITTVTDVAACAFVPVASGTFSCPDTITVETSGGLQTWPFAGQGEQCNPPSAGVMLPGQSRWITAVWPGTMTGGIAATPGSYKAIGTWSWSSSSGQPYVVSVQATFTVA
ncbi:MAG: hypothetical protein ACYDD4_00655 [Acidimicrobiales bacterium]